MYFRPILASVLFALILGCAASGPSPSTSGEPVIFPPPPDSPRIQYLMSFNNQAGLSGSSGAGMLREVLGDEGGQEIVRPYGITSWERGVYICDNRLNALFRVDVLEKTVEEFIPTGRGTLKTPLNCCVDSSGNIYVADSERKQVVIFTPDLDYLGVIGDGSDMKPVDVDFVNGEIWVLDIELRRITVHDPRTYDLLRSIPEGADTRETSFLLKPVNICAGNGKVHVSDVGSADIKVIDYSGALLSTIGVRGDRPGQFVRPRGLAVDRSGNLYAVDAAFENIQIFSDRGELLMPFGGPYRAPGDMYLPADVLIDYRHLDVFRGYVAPGFELKYLIYVTNQYGPDKVSVYGFIGSEAVPGGTGGGG